MSIGSTPHARAGVLDAGWRTAPVAALLVGPDRTILEANETARSLLPSAGPGRSLDDCAPAWLSDADRALRRSPDEASRTGPIGGRTFAARPVTLAAGQVMWWLAETTDITLLEDGLRQERDRTAFLKSASDKLLSSLNVARTMELATELAADRLADAAWVIGPEVRGRHSAVVCMRGQRSRALTLQIDPNGLPGLPEALQGFPPVPSRWVDPAAAPAWVVPDGLGPTGSIVVTSLPGHGVPAGALVLLRSAANGIFSETDESLARLFASRVGAALSAARLFEEQAAITEVLTASLMPPVLEHLDGVDYAGIYRPAQDTARLGGDFYDVHPRGEGRSVALLGDVCGKGLEAAVLAGKIRNTLQALVPMADDHVRMLELLNSSLLSSDGTRFVTLVLASAACEDGRVRLTLTRAGHLPPLIVRMDGRVEEVFGRGSLIGVLPTIEASTQTIELAPGETCLLYTDGIIEARGGPLGDEMFGETRLRRALADCGGVPAEAMVEHVLMLATDWLGGASHDDMAVLAIAAPAAAHPLPGTERG